MISSNWIRVAVAASLLPLAGCFGSNSNENVPGPGGGPSTGATGSSAPPAGASNPAGSGPQAPGPEAGTSPGSK